MFIFFKPNLNYKKDFPGGIYFFECLSFNDNNIAIQLGNLVCPQLMNMINFLYNCLTSYNLSGAIARVGITQCSQYYFLKCELTVQF